MAQGSPKLGTWSAPSPSTDKEAPSNILTVSLPSWPMGELDLVGAVGCLRQTWKQEGPGRHVTHSEGAVSPAQSRWRPYDFLLLIASSCLPWG